MRVLIRVLGEFIAIADKGARSYIKSCSLHLIEQVGPHNLACAAHNFVLALVDDLGFVDRNASLLVNSVLKLVERTVVLRSGLAAAPLNYFIVLLESATFAELPFGLVPLFIISTRKELDTISSDDR